MGLTRAAGSKDAVKPPQARPCGRHDWLVKAQQTISSSSPSLPRWNARFLTRAAPQIMRSIGMNPAGGREPSTQARVSQSIAARRAQGPIVAERQGSAHGDPVCLPSGALGLWFIRLLE